MRSARKLPGTLLWLAAALACALAASPAQAVTSIWQTTDGDYTNAANWDIGAPGLSTNWVMSAPGSTYTVTWSYSATNYAGVLTGANQNVTFDMGGYTHLMNQNVGYAGTEFLLGNVGDNITLTVSNGSFRVREGTNWGLRVNEGNTLIVTNGGQVRTSMLLGNGTVLLSGAGSYLHAQEGLRMGGSPPGGTNIINNGAAAYFRNGNTSIDLLLVDGATVTNVGSVFLNYAGDTIRVINGSLMYGINTGTVLGQQSGSSSRMIVGDAGPVSMISQLAITHEEWYSSSRGNTEVIVSTNGVLQIRGGNPDPMYTTNGYQALPEHGYPDWKVQDNSIITLRGGAIAMNTNTFIGLTDNNTGISPFIQSTEAGTAILRGYGTISNYNAGANFRVLNHGVIRPGDYGYEVGNHSNIVAIGTINIIGGDLLMTNPLSQVGSAIYFDFSETGIDRIAVSGGSALITGGSNIFTLAAGSSTPGPYKWGLGTYDFITGTNVVWQPEYANLTNILAAAGLTEGLEYTFGVRYIGGGLMALRLEFIPEPSTLILLVGGGLLLWRVRRRAGRP